MASIKNLVDYKNSIQINGVVMFADYPVEHPQWGHIGMKLIVTPKMKAKIEAWIAPQIAASEVVFKKKVSGKGLTIVPHTDKDGNDTGNFVVTLKRNANINDKPVARMVFDKEGNRLELENNIGGGSKIQVKVYLYFSNSQYGNCGRIEPNSVRVLELKEYSGPAWDDEEDDDDFADVEPAGQDSFEDDDDEDPDF